MSTVRDQIRALLADGRPRTTAEIFAECDSIDDIGLACKVVNQLASRGDVAESTPVMGSNNRLKKRWTASQANQHQEEQQESEMDASRQLDAGPIRTRCTTAAELLSSATGSQEADESRRPVPFGIAFHHVGDPIVSAINKIEEPRWQEGDMHATRLRALAESAPIARQPDVRAWLIDLAGIIEGMT